VAEEEAGAEGVEVGGQSEIEVEGEEEVQLQGVELAQRNATDLGPASEPSAARTAIVRIMAQKGMRRGLRLHVFFYC